MQKKKWLSIGLIPVILLLSFSLISAAPAATPDNRTLPYDFNVIFKSNVPHTKSPHSGGGGGKSGDDGRQRQGLHQFHG